MQDAFRHPDPCAGNSFRGGDSPGRLSHVPEGSGGKGSVRRPVLFLLRRRAWALIMTFLSPAVAKVAMKFTSAEMLMLAVFGLSVIVSISGKSISKGLISAFFGLLLATVGQDPTYGAKRFVFNFRPLLSGFAFIPVLIGLFAVSEVIAGVERIVNDKEKQEASHEKITRVLPDGKTIRTIWPNILFGGIIGTFIGAIPGAGGDIAVFVSYGFNKSFSRHPENGVPGSRTELPPRNPRTTAAPAGR